MNLLRYFGDKNLSLKNLKHSHEIEISSFEIKTKRIVLARQVHGGKIRLVTEKHTGAGIIKRSIAGVDGLITNNKNIFLCIKTADCIPIFLWDEVKEVVSALHSGRAGVESNIAVKAIRIMQKKFGCKIADIHAEFGPSICTNCYPVDLDTFNKFVRQTNVEQVFPHLDLKKVILSNLHDIGIQEVNILDQSICTKEDGNYFSYREDQTLQRQISIIGMK